MSAPMRILLTRRAADAISEQILDIAPGTELVVVEEEGQDGDHHPFDGYEYEKPTFHEERRVWSKPRRR